MLTTDEIKNYLDKYVIRDGNVYLKSNNQQVLEEETILKVKSARLIYNEAREKYQSDSKQFGKPNGDFKRYVTKTMEQLAVNGEFNAYGINKLINALLTSNGHYEEYMSGNDLINSKFSILVGLKQDYGLAYLKLKFREKGLDVENLNIRQDLTELQHNGISKVIIDFQLKKYEKKVSTSNDQSDTHERNDSQQRDNKFFSHPKSELLNELEKKKKEAQVQNDEVAYNFAQSNIERIIRENPVEVSPEQWDAMGYDERKSFILIKMKEAKVLNDKVSFNFWNSNLKQLEERQQENSISNIQVSGNNTISFTHYPKIEEQPLQNNITNSQPTIETSSSLYNKMVNALKKSRTDNLSPEEKKQIVGEIYYYEGFLVNSVKSEQEIADIMMKAVNDFQTNDFEQSVFNSLVSELQEKIKSFTPEENKDENVINIGKENFSSNINNLKKQMQKLSLAYRKMLLDGMIDDQELDLLIAGMKNLSNTANALKGNNLSSAEYQIVNDILASISSEKQKMMMLRDGIEQSVQHFGR